MTNFYTIKTFIESEKYPQWYKVKRMTDDYLYVESNYKIKESGMPYIHKVSILDVLEYDNSIWDNIDKYRTYPVPMGCIKGIKLTFKKEPSLIKAYLASHQLISLEFEKMKYNNTNGYLSTYNNRFPVFLSFPKNNKDDLFLYILDIDDIIDYVEFKTEYLGDNDQVVINEIKVLNISKVIKECP